jgi:hypothetical protein
MTLDPRRVQAVFWAAVQHHDPGDRAAILDRECSTDPVLRERVEALLRAHDRVSDFLSRPLVIADDTAMPSLWEADDEET